jgi:hypothetical protein
MKHLGAINGPPDLPSRPGFCQFFVEKTVKEKAEVKPSKTRRSETRRAVM